MAVERAADFCFLPHNHLPWLGFNVVVITQIRPSATALNQHVRLMDGCTRQIWFGKVLTLCVLLCFLLLLGLRDPKRVEYGVNRGESRESYVSVRCYVRAVQIETTEGPQRTCWPAYMFMYYYYYYYVNVFLLLYVFSYGYSVSLRCSV